MKLNSQSQGALLFKRTFSHGRLTFCGATFHYRDEDLLFIRLYGSHYFGIGNAAEVDRVAKPSRAKEKN